VNVYRTEDVDIKKEKENFQYGDVWTERNLARCNRKTNTSIDAKIILSDIVQSV
jgi:hypothetical protein